MYKFNECCNGTWYFDNSASCGSGSDQTDNLNPFNAIEGDVFSLYRNLKTEDCATLNVKLKKDLDETLAQIGAVTSYYLAVHRMRCEESSGIKVQDYVLAKLNDLDVPISFIFVDNYLYVGVVCTKTFEGESLPDKLISYSTKIPCSSLPNDLTDQEILFLKTIIEDIKNNVDLVDIGTSVHGNGFAIQWCCKCSDN